MNMICKKMKWGCGMLFAFSGIDGVTDYKSGLVMRSIADGLEIKLPQGNGEIRFSTEDCDFGGDYLLSDSIRGAFADAHHFLFEGTVDVSGISDPVKSISSGNRTLVGVTEFFNPNLLLNADMDSLIADRRCWLDSFRIEDPVLRKACSQLKTQIYSPEGNIKHRWSTPDRWPHRAMWIWDSAFHAIGMRHLDLELAREILLAVFDGQDEDGFIPHMCAPDKKSNITQPPVLAYAAEKLQQKNPSQEFLKEFYPKNARFLKWIMANRDTDGAGLVEWYIEGDPGCRCGESGMDNSIRFDCASQLDAPDFNAFLSHDCRIMEQFARELNLADEAEFWLKEWQRLNELMNNLLWDAEYGLYFDRDAKTGKLTGIGSSAGFLPLICGAPSQAQAEAMTKNLKAPERFGTKVMIPSIARNQPGFCTDMWRGPMWTNINLMIAEGFADYGFQKEAQRIFEITQETVRKYAERFGTFFEFYDADDLLVPTKLMRKGENDMDHQPLHDYGWTATLYIDRCFLTPAAINNKQNTERVTE